MKRVLLFVTAVTLCACSEGISGGSVRDTLGLDRSAPDEFKVVKRPPLSVPPEFALRPPTPGAPPRGVASAEEEAQSAVLSGSGRTTNLHSASQLESSGVETAVDPVMSSNLPSSGDSVFMQNAGVGVADEDIRSKLFTDTKNPETSKESKFAIQNWLGGGADDEVVDPFAESERIRENLDEEKPLNEGEVKTYEDGDLSTIDMLF